MRSLVRRYGARLEPLGALGLLAAASLFAAEPARAYRTAQDSASAMGISGPVAWDGSPVGYTLTQSGSDDIAFPDVEAAIQRSFNHWSEPSCSGLRIRYDGSTTSVARARDGRYVVSWVETSWASHGYPNQAIGVTTPQYASRDGRSWYISEADMELNGDIFHWVIEGGSAGSLNVDIESIVTHESGHFFGLLHPCEYYGQDGAPDCRTNHTWDDTTMFPAYVGESQRVLKNDDIMGICFLYPGGGGGGCATTGCPDGQTCGADGVCRVSSGGDCRTLGCPAGQTCGSDGMCSGSAGSCLTAGCPSGQLCGPDGVCYAQTRDCTETGCPAGQECIDGTCQVPSTGALGDVCAVNGDCNSGICATGIDQFCTQYCDSGACPEGFRCTSVGGGKHVCDPASGHLGDACDANADCLSGQCATSGSASFCTRECGPGNACPESFDCTPAGDARVCVKSGGGCGCRLPGNAPAGAGTSLGWLALGASLALLLWRRRR